MLAYAGLMPPDDDRRVYYDHEPAYRQLAARGGTGWDDWKPEVEHDSYGDLERFLASPLCPAARGARALDLGCGGGQAGFCAARRGFALTGIDYSETAVALARDNAARLGIAAHFVRGDCLALQGIADAGFDLVIDNHVLHCVIEPAHRVQLLTSVRRVLNPDGVLFSATMSAELPLDWEAMGVDPVTRVDGRRTRFWVLRAELERELAAAGLEVLEMLGTGATEDDPVGDLLTVARPARP